MSIAANLGSTAITLTDELSEFIDTSSANFLIKINSNINIDRVIFENTDGSLTTEQCSGPSFEKEINIIPDKTYTVSIVTSDGKTSLKKNTKIC